jgi:ParB/RepB/Spo0J family partition protein
MPLDPEGAARARRRMQEMTHAVRNMRRVSLTSYDPASASGDVATMVTVERGDDGMFHVVDIQRGAAMPRRTRDGVEQPVEGYEGPVGVDEDAQRERQEEEEPAVMGAGLAPTELPEQQELELAREEYRPRLRQVPIADIELAGSVLEPSTAFVENVRLLGITQPVALIDAPAGQAAGFRIAAGRRRVRAAILCEMTQVPALVFPADTPMRVAASIALSENTHRAPNPITDLEAIESLAREGYDREHIANALRIPLNVLDARMVMAALSPAMRTAVANGRIAVGVAQRIARLDTRRRATLEEMLLATGRVTGPDVRAIMQARTEEAVAALPDSMFGGRDVIGEPGQSLAMESSVNGLPIPVTERVFENETIGEVQEAHVRLTVARPDGTDERTAQVLMRLSVVDGIDIAVDSEPWIAVSVAAQERQHAIDAGVRAVRAVAGEPGGVEYQGEARVRSRPVDAGYHVARMVARWPNGQTTVELRRDAEQETLPLVIVGGETFQRARERYPWFDGMTTNGIPIVRDTAVRLIWDNGMAEVRRELDENGLTQWMIGGQEVVSRESVAALVNAQASPLVREMIADDANAAAAMEESWESVRMLLERAEQLLPAEPNPDGERGFSLVMEALDHVRTLAQREMNPPVEPSAAAAALAAQENDLAERQRLAAERAAPVARRRR